MKNVDSYLQYKNLLKKYVLTKAGVYVASPGDCKMISAAVEKITGKVISETTLKRFLGFARQQYNLSAFTLNTLSEYVGFKGWEHFCHAAPSSGDALESYTMWEQCRQKALSLTHMTQKMLVNLTGIPFECTVSRQSKEHDFSYFLGSEYQLFCLTGAPGMGKSVQMAHLAKKFFLAENAPYEQSILLMIKPGTLRDFSSDINLEDAFIYQFGMKKEFNFLEYFYQRPAEVKGNIVLMMDGFDEYLYEPARVDLIFKRIADLLSYFRGMTWLKIVLSLRPDTWMLVKEKIDDSEYLKQTWFSGFFYQKELKSNLLPLNEKEIQQVVTAIQQETQSTLTWNSSLYALFSFPYYLHLCYQMLKKKPHTILRGNALFCELVASFVFHKIDRFHYSIEKNKIVQQFVELIDYGKSGDPVEKRQLLEGQDALVLAYNELIAEGILQEKDSDGIFDYQLYVQFVHDPLLTYFIVQGLMDKEKNGDVVIEKIIHEYEKDTLRKMLLKWVLWHQLLKKAGKIPDIFSAALSADEKGELFIFICDLLEENPGIMDEASKDTFINDSITFIIAHFFELKQLGLTYDEAFRTLLKHAIDPVHEADLSIFLAVLALSRFDEKEMMLAIGYMRQLDENIWTTSYPFNPLQALEFIHDYYAGNQPDYSFLDQIDAFIRRSPTENIQQERQVEYTIACQLAAFVFMLCRPSTQMISFTDSLKKDYPLSLSDNPCSAIIPYLEAFAYLQCSVKSQVVRIVEQLEKCYEKTLDERKYSHSDLLLGMVKGEVAIAEDNYALAKTYFDKVYEACKQNNFVLLQIYAVLSLIKVYKWQQEFDKAYSILDDTRKSLSHTNFPVEELLLKRNKEEI